MLKLFYSLPLFRSAKAFCLSLLTIKTDCRNSLGSIEPHSEVPVRNSWYRLHIFISQFSEAIKTANQLNFSLNYFCLFSSASSCCCCCTSSPTRSSSIFQLISVCFVMMKQQSWRNENFWRIGDKGEWQKKKKKTNCWLNTLLLFFCESDKKIHK